MSDSALTVAITVDLPVMEIVAQLSDVQRRALFDGLAKVLGVTPATAASSAPPRPAPPEPRDVTCSDCPTEISIQLGHRPKKRCPGCNAQKNRDMVRARYYTIRGLPVPSSKRERRAAPSPPRAHAVDLRKSGPEPPPVVNRRTEVERRIGAMMALDQGDPRAQSTLLKRFDERRGPRR